ncbi:type II secretion system protein [Candidatus Saccharibacteria bacterium]|nr:type II secretion system protein [Candidatus Saccharibacteria bacterium]
MKIKLKLGFTIVELLIVIVVIAILAAITIVAYNGIQTRAETAKNVAHARSFVTAFKLLQQEGSLPSGAHCLGDPAVYSGGNCTFNGSTGSVNNDLNERLAQAGASSSTRMNPKWNNGGLYYHGNWFGDYQVLVYGVDASQPCGLPNVLSLPWHEMTLSGADHTNRSTVTTVCYIFLGDLR